MCKERLNFSKVTKPMNGIANFPLRTVQVQCPSSFYFMKEIVLVSNKRNFSFAIYWQKHLFGAFSLWGLNLVPSYLQSVHSSLKCGTDRNTVWGKIFLKVIKDSASLQEKVAGMDLIFYSKKLFSPEPHKVFYVILLVTPLFRLC